MNNKISFVILFVGVPALVSVLTSIITVKTINRRPTTHVLEYVQKTPKSTQPIDDWEVFRQALIQIESEGNETVINYKTGAYGLYQILPKGGYLDDYNQLTNNNKTVEDLKDVELQHRIFDVVQSRYNPEKNLKKALEVHNPRAMSPNYITTYEYKVMYWFYKIKYESLIVE